MKTDQEIITEAKHTILTLATMLEGVCNEVGIDMNTTKMTVYADEEPLACLSIRGALDKVELITSDMDKIGF